MSAPNVANEHHGGKHTKSQVLQNTTRRHQRMCHLSVRKRTHYPSPSRARTKKGLKIRCVHAPVNRKEESRGSNILRLQSAADGRWKSRHNTWWFPDTFVEQRGWQDLSAKPTIGSEVKIARIGSKDRKRMKTIHNLLWKYGTRHSWWKSFLYDVAETPKNPRCPQR